MYADPKLAKSAEEIRGPGYRYQGKPALIFLMITSDQADIFHYDAVIKGEKTMTDTIDQT